MFLFVVVTSWYNGLCVWEMGVSSHDHALICMLSSLETGTPHCKRFSSQRVISLSLQIPLELVVRIDLESLSV